MYPENYNNNPYGYPYNNNSFGGWFLLFALLVLTFILLKLGDNLIESEAGSSDNSCNTNGIAEYWYSDTPEQSVNTSSAVNKRPVVRRTAVTDKDWVKPNAHNTPNASGTIKGIFFWI